MIVETPSLQVVWSVVPTCSPCCVDSECRTCELTPSKDDSNPLNKYDHNFAGKYCYCDGAYQEGQDTMLQCLRCEDWFHDRCLSNPSSSQGLLVCKTCASECSFLQAFALDQPLLSMDHNCLSNRQFPAVQNELFLHQNFEDVMCKCDACLDLYQRGGIEFLVDASPSEEPSSEPLVDEVDENVPLQPMFDPEQILLNKVSQMSHEQASTLAQVLPQMNDFNQIVKAEIKRYVETHHVQNISAEAMGQILKNVGEIVGNKRRRLS